jgi:hypothetical protein
MQPTLNGAQRDAELLRDLGVAQSLEVREKEDFLEGRRHAVHSPLHELIPFLTLKTFIRGRDIDLHEVNECLPAFAPLAPAPLVHRGGEIHFLTTYLLTEHVTGFVRGNCEKPRFEAAGGVKRVRGYMDLKEGFLEDILSRLPVAGQAHEESDQVILVALYQRPKGRGVPVPVVVQELFVGSGGQSWSGKDTGFNEPPLSGPGKGDQGMNGV